MVAKVIYGNTVEINSMEELKEWAKGFRSVKTVGNCSETITLYLYNDSSIGFAKESDKEKADKFLEFNGVSLKKQVIEGDDCFVGNDDEIFSAIEMLSKNYNLIIL